MTYKKRFEHPADRGETSTASRIQIVEGNLVDERGFEPSVSSLETVGKIS
jgi:hypothetical protein